MAMKLPEGFTVTVGAAEPQVQQPIAMAIDDRGRVWIAEAYEYPIRAKGKNGRDRILIFEDTDGDGSLDRRKVFMEGSEFGQRTRSRVRRCVGRSRSLLHVHSPIATVMTSLIPSPRFCWTAGAIRTRTKP